MPCSKHFRGLGLTGDQCIYSLFPSPWGSFQVPVCERGLMVIRQGMRQVLELFWQPQRLQLGETLVRTRRAIPRPYTYHFNYRPNKTCRSKKAKIISLIKLYKLCTKADSHCLHPCQGKGAYLAWGKRIWVCVGGGLCHGNRGRS